jgi:SAM-dependent methyltransferase
LAGDDRSRALLESYERVAADYAEHFRDDLAHKPFDRKMLDWLIEKAGAAGPICDMGCGPGQIARYLRDRGAEACGIDLSPAMVREARMLHPGIDFGVGDMLDLRDVPEASFGGIAAFYSIVHLPAPRLPQALRELSRVLRPGGPLLLAFHVGSEVVHRDEWWGKDVDVDFFFFETADVKRNVEVARFDLEEVIERDPYPDIEYPSRRAYVFARR